MTTQTAPAMTEELAQQIDAAGFSKLAATGMTDPILANRLRITKEEILTALTVASRPILRPAVSG